MSFKNVRDLAEHLKLLGFPNVLPLQALATHHGSLAGFLVVTELLQLLTGLLEPGVTLPGDVTTEDERVQLIRNAIEFFVIKSAKRLNPRKLYAASAVTASELLKITENLLITPKIDEREQEESEHNLNQVDIGDKMDKLRHARELSSDLTQRGATLYDLLTKERLNKDARQTNHPMMELAAVERTLKNTIMATKLKLQTTRAKLESSRVELNALNSKIQRKCAELERTKQRLEALQKIRPAHMEEFEECEKELELLFQKYFLYMHVRDALDARIKRVNAASLPLLEKTLENSSMPFVAESNIKNFDEADEDDFDVGDELGAVTNGINTEIRGNYSLDSEIPDIRDEDLLLQNENSTMANKRPETATFRMRPTTARSRKATKSDGINEDYNSGAGIFAGVANDELGQSISVNANDNDSTFDSSDSELNACDIMGMNSLGGIATAGDDDFELNSMEDISISKITGELPIRLKTSSKRDHQSDEDF